MQRINRLIQSVAEPENLRSAFWKARKGKSCASEVETFRENLDINLKNLRTQILNTAVEVGPYRYFKVYEPKERQICASAFGEQVLHHALMNICHAYFERPLIFNTYASRKGKGTYAALERAKIFTHQNRFFLKLDVRKFFESVEHDVLKLQLKRLFKDKVLLYILFQIIDSYEAHPNRGLPIGNLTSQYFANHYLCGLDHFIKETLCIKAYVRYMDDMVLWHDDKEVLKNAFHAINHFVVNELKCTLKPHLLNFSSAGLPFLGYRLKPNSVRLTTQSKKRFIKKIKIVEYKYQTLEWSESRCQSHALPLLAFVQHAETRGLRKKIFFEV